MLICLIGCTCSGKSTILNELHQLGVEKIVTYTTRPPRSKDEFYYFLSDDEFYTLNNMGYFATISQFEIDTDTVWQYGVAKANVFDDEKDRCLIINPQEVDYYRNLDNCIIVYLYANNEIIWNRLRTRGSGADDARRRIESDTEAFKGILDKVDFAIKNDGYTPSEEIARYIKAILDTKGEKG